MSQAQSTVSLKDLPRLKRAYDMALELKCETFMFEFADGTTNEVLTSYAKYLLEYLEMELRKMRA